MTNITPKTVFLGTPEFSVPILEKLLNSDYKPIAVFCAPDKPIGRQQILTPPPAKIVAQKYDIPIFQPANSHELADTLKSLSPDLIITAAYGLILPKEVLDAPKYGCLNIHPSLLPKYRGPSPIQSAILNGDTTTGVTIYKMDEQIDHGPTIANSQWPLANSKITTPELSKELSELGANLLVKILPDWLAGKITPQPQDDSQTTLTKIITKEDGQIDWQKSALAIERQIRAYTPWPGSHTTLSNYSLPSRRRGASLATGGSEVEESKIKIIQVEVSHTNKQLYPERGRRAGEVFLTDADDLAVQTGSGALVIKKLQLEGGEPLSASDFLRGHKNLISMILV